MVTVKEKYGFLPFSVMKFKNVPDNYKKENEALHINLTRRSKDCKYLPSLKYSKFSFGLSEFVIKYWSNPYDTVLDPFMGWGIRGVVADKLNRNYIGIEVSPSMYKHTCEYFMRINAKNTVNLGRGDGCELASVKSDDIDLIFTCPPYWNIEKYESIEGQLSDCKTYNIFLEKMKKSLWNSRRVLKKNKFAIYVVADFRSKRILKPFHSDLISISQKMGFQLWDIMISELNSPFKWTQIGKCDRMKYSSKCHEYILVFKK